MAFFTVCIPSFNAERTISATIDSLLSQTFTDWECLVVDDASTDHTEQLVRGLKDLRITFIKNDKNLGCPGNFQRCRELATGKYIYFLANDDLISPLALERVYSALQAAPDVALVTRPYYIFEGDDPDVPIRYEKPLDHSNDRVLSIDDEEALGAILSTLGQVTGLAFRNDALNEAFSPYVFTTHIHPFLATFRSHRAIFLRDYLVAVRKESSQSRNLPAIYKVSPLWSWVHMMETVFGGPQWKRQREIGKEHILKHVEGLVQVRCSAPLSSYVYEAYLYVKFRPLNLLSARYWIFALACLLMPRSLLRRLVDRLTPVYTKAPQAGIALATP